VTGSSVLYAISNSTDPTAAGRSAMSTRLIRSTMSRPGPTSPQSPRTEATWMSPVRSLASLRPIRRQRRHDHPALWRGIDRLQSRKRCGLSAGSGAGRGLLCRLYRQRAVDHVQQQRLQHVHFGFHLAGLDRCRERRVHGSPARSSVLLDAGDGAVANAVYAKGYIYAVFEVYPPDRRSRRRTG